MISLEKVFCYLQGNNSINVLKREFKTFLCLEGFPYFQVLLEAGTTVLLFKIFTITQVTAYQLKIVNATTFMNQLDSYLQSQLFGGAVRIKVFNLSLILTNKHNLRTINE